LLSQFGQGGDGLTIDPGAHEAIAMLLYPHGKRAIAPVNAANNPTRRRIVLYHRLRLMGAERPASAQQMDRLEKTGFTRAIGAEKRSRAPRKANLHAG
jgi:hypothetical protein